jgi:uncharacterized repeat protein (TIGR02543 family)
LFALLLGAVVALGGGVPAARAAGTPTLKIEGIGQGTVTGPGITCGLGSLTCYSGYGTDMQPVTLTATPASGWTFSHWEDDASTCAGTPCTISVTGAMTATAVFAIAGAAQTSTLTVSSTNGGVSNGSSSAPIDCDPDALTPTTDCSLTALTGSTVTVAEAPDSGYLFDGWGGSCAGAGPTCAVYLQADRAVSAGFILANSNPLTVTVSGSGSVSGGGISCGAGATCSAPQPSNATVTLTATPASGFTLTNWSGGCTGTQPTCTVQMSAATSVTATFAQLVTLSVTVSGNGYVTGGGIGCDGGQTCMATETPSTSLTLTAHPNAGGSVFWSGCTSTAGTFCTVTVGTTAQSVTATFSGGAPPPIATNSLTLTVNGDGYVVSSSGSTALYCTAADGSGCTTNVPANTTVTLRAIPASGDNADFTGWTGDCSAFTSTSCTLTLSSSKSVVASFAGGNTTYALTGQVVGSGTIAGGGLSCTSSGGAGCNVQQAAGAGITLTASAGFGATFTGWTGACTGTSTTCSVSMTNAKSVTATFATGTSTGTTSSLALTVTPAGTVAYTGGTCASTGTKSKTCTAEFAHGQKVPLEAKPAVGYAFTHWTGACAGKKAACDVTLTSSVVVGAVFERLVLAPKRAAAVVKTSGGYRVTLSYLSRVAGKLKVTAKRGSATVGTKTGKVKAGSHRISLTVKSKGRYVFTLAVGKHAIRWRVTIR